jgi:hypothetical protein
MAKYSMTRVEYFATSYIISTWEMNILGIFHDVATTPRIPSCSCELAHIHLFTCSPIHLLMSLLQAKERELNKLQLEIIMLNQSMEDLE